MSNDIVTISGNIAMLAEKLLNESNNLGSVDKVKLQTSIQAMEVQLVKVRDSLLSQVVKAGVMSTKELQAAGIIS